MVRIRPGRCCSKQVSHTGELRHRKQREKKAESGGRCHPFPSALPVASGARARQFKADDLLGIEFCFTVGEQVGQLLRRLEAIVRVLGVQPGDDVAQPLGSFGNDLFDRPRRVLDDAAENSQRGRRSERRVTGGHGIEDAAKAEQVGSVVDHQAFGLFGGHVQGSTGEHSALRQTGVVCGSRQTEIGQLGPDFDACFDQDVAWFDIAMNQPPGMSSDQPQRNLLPQPQHLRNIQRAIAIQLLLESDSFHELHDQTGVRLLFDGINLHDVLVLDLSRRSPSRRNRMRGGDVIARWAARNLIATTRCKLLSYALNTIPKAPWPSTSSKS